MSGGAMSRGQPLFLLAGVLIGWTGLRIAFWQPVPDGLPDPAAPVERGEPARLPAAAPLTAAEVPGQPAAAPPSPEPAPQRTANPPGWIVPVVPAPLPPIDGFSLGPVPTFGAGVADSVSAPRRMPARAIVGHNMLLAAGLAQMEIPATLIAYLQPAGLEPDDRGGAVPGPLRPAPVNRWSGDAWLMMRNDTISPIQPGLPSYGRSQAGAVVRYNLAPSSAMRPQAYVRASGAISGERDQELAAGLSARPIPAVPVRVAAEARASRTATGTELRPAAYAVTELPPARLPLGTRGELYVQGGYAGGSNSTAFIDGQARVEKSLSAIKAAQLTVGAGAWGGAQEGVTRFDIGPTVALTFRIGEGRGRLAADYRIRVAGDAEPKSGPALTLSAGF